MTSESRSDNKAELVSSSFPYLISQAGLTVGKGQVLFLFLFFPPTLVSGPLNAVAVLSHSSLTNTDIPPAQFLGEEQ